jgi:acyl-CoA synthetase (AMP-forming)/AMP-acid ligase II
VNPFWQLEQHGASSAVVTDSGASCSYAELAAAADAWCQRLGPQRQLIFLQCRNNLSSLAAYLACLRQGHCVLLLAESLDPAQLRQLQQAFQPHWLIEADGTAHPLSAPTLQDEGEAALLLSTSGSTGSPKQVALSRQNLQANAASILDYLQIGADERPISSLPMHYSYGLSVIHSHLLAGACLLLTDRPLVSREFWDFFRQQQATSLAGVPTSYELLERLRLERLQLASLRTLTQAGGRLAPEKAQRFARLAREQGWRFFVMYGQTEAGPRMSYLPPELAEEFPDSIGIAIPGGSFSLLDDQGGTIEGMNQTGELIYRGANVMLGYVSDRVGLSQLEHPTQLHTGDLAYRNAQGLYVITGRLKRFIKIHGHRLSLDEVEQRLQQAGLDVRAAGRDERLVIAHRDADAAPAIQQQLTKLGLQPRSYQLLWLQDWPLTANGKLAYELLLELADRPI